MNKLNFVATLLLVFISQLLIGQNITGTVLDSKGKGVFFATVALYNNVDSTVVDGVSTDDNGNFNFQNIKQGDYYLIASMLGYQQQRIDNINVASSNLSYNNIVLVDDQNLLETVEIVDKLPLMQQKADKLVVNVEGNITNTSGSLLDVMKKVPGMLVINDRLSLAGSGTPTILLNGKTTQYLDVQSLLRDMPGENIKKVEIIHQPGAEYEASGSGPIINIILKKNSLFGTNGNVTLGVGKGELWDYTSGINLSHYQGSFNVNVGAGYTKNAYAEEIELTRRLSGIGDGIDGTYSQLNIDKATPRTYRGNITMDWDITEKHRLGLSSKYYNNSNNRIATNVTEVDLLSQTATDYTLTTDNTRNNGWNYRSLNPYYIYEIDTSGQKLEIDLNMANYQVDAMNILSTTNTINSLLDQQRYVQPCDTKIFASTIDYTKPINDNLEIKAGAKYSNADLDNDLQSTFFQEDSWVNNTLQSNRYLFNERIYATYGKANWNTGAWSGTVGLRYEKSESTGESVTLDSILTRPISKLFPSFSLSREIGKGLKSTVAYSYRINRPRYSSLNSFVYYLDPFTYERGNQNLRPELTHSAKFTLSMDGQPFIFVEYKESTDAIVEVTEQERDSEEAFKTDLNFDGRSSFSTTLLFPLDFIPGISGYGGTVITRTSFNSFYNNDIFERSKWNTTFFLQAQFKLPGEINAELGGWYTGSNQEGIFNTEYLFGSEFAISKKILNDKGKISIGVEDFVNRFWNASVDYQQDLDLTVRWQAPVVNARFSYKFGNQHLKTKSKSTGSASEELRRASQGN
jgi:hypothetical protein